MIICATPHGMRVRRIALCFTTSLSQLDWERSCEVVIKIQWDGATFHLEGTVTWTRVGSGHLPPRVLILEHLIGARDNDVGGSDVSPCRWRGICCTSFCVRSPLRNLLLSAAKLWRATVRSIDRALLCCKRVGDTHSRHRRDQFNHSASRHFSHSATANSERCSDLLVHKISPAHPGAIKST